ncbi:glycosyltransferase, partial [Pluralibacter gergoviae]
YPEKRCIMDTSLYECKNLNKTNVRKYSNYLRRKVLKKQERFIFAPFFEYNSVNSYIFFNDIPAKTTKKWIGIFETMIPRIPETMNFHRTDEYEDCFSLSSRENIKKLLDRMVFDNCISLNALSNNAKVIQSALLDLFPEYKDPLFDKIKVLHPPQKIFFTKEMVSTKWIGETIRFIFVGKDFYRKGGAEVVLAFNELVKTNKIPSNSIELTIIGKLDNRFNYAHGNYQDDMSFYHDVESIIKSSTYITYHDELSHIDVMHYISRSHVGLLPTWADTYGYSVLEFQSHGVPVITTDVRALSEINYSNYIIQVKKNRFSEIVVNSKKDKEMIRRDIIQGIKSYILYIMGDKIVDYSMLEDIHMGLVSNHDPEKYFNQLYSLIK